MIILLRLTLLTILTNALVINGECQCGIFLMDESGNSAINEVYLSETHPQACHRLELDQLCRDFCYQTFVNLTADGNLEATSPVGNMSIGEMFCENLQQEVDRRQVGGYYRWCQASWKSLGIKTSHSLCCANSSYVRCDDDVGKPSTSAEPTPEFVATEPSQTETNQTEAVAENPSDKLDNSQNETSTRDALRIKRNLIKIIQIPRKISEKSSNSGPKTPAKLLYQRSAKNIPEIVQEPTLVTLSSNAEEEDVTNVTEEVTENSVAKDEIKNWSPQVNTSEWIPILYLPKVAVKEKNETRTRREISGDQGPTLVHLTAEVLVAINDNFENITESVLEDVVVDDNTSKPTLVDSERNEEIPLKWDDHQGEMTTALPVSDATEL